MIIIIMMMMTKIIKIFNKKKTNQITNNKKEETQKSYIAPGSSSLHKPIRVLIPVSFVIVPSKTSV